MSMIINSYQRFWGKSKTLPLRHFLDIGNVIIPIDQQFSEGEKPPTSYPMIKSLAAGRGMLTTPRAGFFSMDFPWEFASPLVESHVDSRCDSNFLGLSLW